MKFNVGQIIYLVDIDKNAILSARVVEHVTKKTMSGNVETYFVQVPNKSSLLDLSTFDGEHFIDTGDVLSFLLDNLKKNVENIVSKAENLARETWPDAYEVTSSPLGSLKDPVEEIKPSATEEVESLVDLGDGRVARYRQ
jgi:hypothetical protein